MNNNLIPIKLLCNRLKLKHDLFTSYKIIIKLKVWYRYKPNSKLAACDRAHKATKMAAVGRTQTHAKRNGTVI